MASPAMRDNAGRGFGKWRKNRQPREPIKIDRTKIPFKKSIIEDPMLNLPAVIHDPIEHKYYHLLVEELPEFVSKDLDVERLEDAQNYLWICGAQGRYRPLHRQKGLLGRQIIINEQADLHLTWDADSLRMFVKPLPAYLLNRQFWEVNICGNEKRFQNALGFLRTYVHLIPHEIDLDHALEERLLPRIHAPVSRATSSNSGENSVSDGAASSSRSSNGNEYSKGEDITWPQWRAFVDEFLTEYPAGIPDELRGTRWEYSELRTGRLNLAYRLFMGSPLRGYQFGYSSYGSFLSRNSSWLIATFAYVAIVHGAMQVGLATPQLDGNQAFARASYGFAVFSIAAPVGVLTILVAWMVIIFLNNLVWTTREKKKTRPRGPRDVESHPHIPIANVQS